MEYIYYLYLIARHIFVVLMEGGGNPFRHVSVETKRKMLILANGPSLKSFIQDYERNRKFCEECDFFGMNDLVNDDVFLDLKPKYYVLSDPKFFYETLKKESGLSVMYGLRDRVTWPMYLFVSKKKEKSEYLKIVKDNSNITIVFYHKPKFPVNLGLEKIRNFVFSKGWGNGEYGTVLLHAIYISITMGVKKIELYGADHTYFDSLCIDENNRPCIKYSHSYGEAELVPILDHDGSEVKYKDMDTYIYQIAQIFRGHKLMASYAKYKGVDIVNRTKGSMIDVYKRIY